MEYSVRTRTFTSHYTYCIDVHVHNVNRYAFDESDLETSIAVLKRFLNEQGTRIHIFPSIHVHWLNYTCPRSDTLGCIELRNRTGIRVHAVSLDVHIITAVMYLYTYTDQLWRPCDGWLGQTVSHECTLYIYDSSDSRGAYVYSPSSVTHTSYNTCTCI